MFVDKEVKNVYNVDPFAGLVKIIVRSQVLVSNVITKFGGYWSGASEKP